MKPHKFFKQLDFEPRVSYFNTHSLSAFLSDLFDWRTYHFMWTRFIHRRRYGVDYVELWNLDMTMLALLYERLSLFKMAHLDEMTDKDTLFLVDGESHSLSVWVDEILRLTELSLSNNTIESTLLDDIKEPYDAINRVWRIWSVINQTMWT